MAEVELNDIISSFEANNCQTIPNKLLEYQMFNQPYYTGRILRLLLAPRQVPSPPDTRERLIEALKKRDKSHQSMFAKYERECKKLNNSTSNGKGSSSSKMLLMYSPLEEKLERLKRHYEDNEDQLGPILSQVSTAINQVVNDIKKSIINNNDKSSKKHNGDICSPGLKEWEIQVVELLLKYITEIIVKISLPLHESEADITDKQFVLVDLFVKMLSSHTELHWPLVMMVYELLHDKFDPSVWLPWELSFDISSDFLTPLARRRFRRVALSSIPVVKQVELVLCSVLLLQMRYCSGHLLESIRVAINNNQFESIQLINELIGLATPTFERPLPLLMNSFAVILENYDNEMHKIKLVQNFMSLMLRLPPYLVFANTPTTPPTEESLISLARFINENMLLHINVDFVLSLDVTHHLITGLKQSLDKTPSLWSLAELFLEKCPILLTSILYHWSELCVLSEDNIIKENMPKEMTNICEWAK
uniref:Uncharacterized protein n=1 Tax=Amphimedon queenslandica TaxID=400682 RepID=A0A1X7TLY0_AMPQE